MQWYWFLLGSLATWRITHLLAAEDGPWKIFSRLRASLEKTLLGDLVSCFYCLSVWIAFPFALLIASPWRERILLWLALSGAAILIEQLAHRPASASTAYYIEDQEEPSDVLRK
jgi:hypothetical protein